MRHAGKHFFCVLLMAFLATLAFAQDNCAICGKPIDGTIYLVTDEVTGQQKEVCSNCIQLPRCFICGLPVKDDGKQLSDGRWLCSRDSQTAVLDADTASQVAGQVRDELDTLFARYTTFPTNVNVNVIDRVDVDSMFQPVGNSFESPNLLGCIQPIMDGDRRHFEMSLLTGLPMIQLKATAAHEFSHAWVGENVSPQRHAGIARDAEEGFCEMVSYLLMDSEGQDGEKGFILRNHYTRGQVQLFIAAEQQYGFESILDWMKYGESSKLEDGHPEEVRNVKTPAGSAVAAPSSALYASVAAAAPVKPASSVSLQGILWGNPPVAIINGKTVFANDRFTVNIDGQQTAIHCILIQKNFVRIEYTDTGRQEDVHLWNQ
ncbi:MAG TPA: protein DA1 [Verrucomicrobiae bacterium]